MQVLILNDGSGVTSATSFKDVRDMIKHVDPLNGIHCRIRKTEDIPVGDGSYRDEDGQTRIDHRIVYATVDRGCKRYELVWREVMCDCCNRTETYEFISCEEVEMPHEDLPYSPPFEVLRKAFLS